MNVGFWRGVKTKLSMGLRGGAGDSIVPTCTITCAQTSPTAVTPLQYTITFSEDVTGFEVGDFTVGNGTKSNFAGSGAVYTCDVTPTAAGNVTADVAAGVCVDAAGNENEAASQLMILYINPVMWVAADKLTGLSDGGAVTTWTDLSGGTNSPTQAVAEAKPAYKTNILNGLPVVRGDGGDSLEASYTLNQPYTRFLVFKVQTEADAKALCDGSTINTAKFSEITAASDLFRFYAGANLNITHPDPANFAIATLRVNGASSRITIGATSASGNPGAGNAGGIALFANGSGTEWSISDIAEAIDFSGALSDSLMNLIGAYLGTKYGLTWINF